MINNLSCLRSIKQNFPKPAPIEWAYLIFGLVLIAKNAWIIDDAFVYFRYVDNFLFLKIGLVYNNGEYVEGYSSPAWTLLLILLRATRMDYPTIVKTVGIASYAIFWLMMVKLNRQLSPKTITINFPLAFLTFSFGPLTHFTSGLESPLIQIAAVAYALYIINPNSAILQTAIAISPLIRPELAATSILCVIWAFIHNKKIPWRIILAGAAFNGTWLLFRIYYYADMLPNTFYLKDEIAIKQGLAYVKATIIDYNLHYIALAYIILVALIRLKTKTNLELPKRLAMLMIATPVIAYTIKIGGFWWHYKYLAFPFCLTICAFSGIIEHFYNSYRKPILLIPIIALMIVSIQTQYTEKIIHMADRIAKQPYMEEKVPIKYLEEYKKQNPEVIYEKTEALIWCSAAYKKFSFRVIQSLGLTDSILARINVGFNQRSHKRQLEPKGSDIRGIHDRSEYIGAGMYRKAVEEGTAPPWVKNNLESIEIIERKIYNKHNLWENLQLAFTFPEGIKVKQTRLPGKKLKQKETSDKKNRQQPQNSAKQPLKQPNA